MYLDLIPSANLFYGFIGKDWKRLTIIPNVSDATIIFTASPKVVMGNSVWVPKGTTVTYIVRATGYKTETGTVLVDQNESINIELEVLMLTLTVTPTPSNAIVTLSAEGYVQSGNSIIVPYGTQVMYEVSATGYISKSSSLYVYTAQTLLVPLSKVTIVGSGASIATFDGSTWSTVATSSSSTTWTGAKYFGDTNYPWAISDTGHILRGNGQTASVTSATLYDLDLTPDGNNLLVVGENVILSQDNVGSWSTALSVNSTWNSICHGNGLSVVVGEDKGSGYNVALFDGSTWNTSFEGSSGPIWKDVIYVDDGLNKYYIAVGSDGLMYRTTTSSTWSKYSLLDKHSWTAITYWDSRYVAVGFDGSIAITEDITDSTSWSLVREYSGRSYTDVIGADDYLIAIGMQGIVSMPTDFTAQQWTDSVVVGSGISWMSAAYYSP